MSWRRGRRRKLRHQLSLSWRMARMRTKSCTQDSWRTSHSSAHLARVSRHATTVAGKRLLKFGEAVHYHEYHSGVITNDTDDGEEGGNMIDRSMIDLRSS